MKYISLFSGIGGFELALNKLGHECVFACDIDEHARKTYFKNFNLWPAGDITKVPAKHIPEHELLVGGFPCTTFSNAGNRQGINDPRGRLFREIIRIMKHHRPKYALLENVRSILTANSGEAMQIIKDEFKQHGYIMQHKVLTASDFNIPQTRTRAILFLTRDDLTIPKFNEPKKQKLKTNLIDIMETNPAMSKQVNHQRVHWRSPAPSTARTNTTILLGHVDGRRSQGYAVWHFNGVAGTITTSGGGIGHNTGLYLDPQQRIRRLNVLETKRVMGFPDNHKVGNGSQAYARLGNAVVPQMIEAAAKACGL